MNIAEYYYQFFGHGSGSQSSRGHYLITATMLHFRLPTVTRSELKRLLNIGRLPGCLIQMPSTTAYSDRILDRDPHLRVLQVVRTGREYQYTLNLDVMPESMKQVVHTLGWLMFGHAVTDLPPIEDVPAAIRQACITMQVYPASSVNMFEAPIGTLLADLQNPFRNTYVSSGYQAPSNWAPPRSTALQALFGNPDDMTNEAVRANRYSWRTARLEATGEAFQALSLPEKLEILVIREYAYQMTRRDIVPVTLTPAEKTAIKELAAKKMNFSGGDTLSRLVEIIVDQLG